LKAYLVLCPVNQPLMRLAENERSEVRSASRIIPCAKPSGASIW